MSKPLEIDLWEIDQQLGQHWLRDWRKYADPASDQRVLSEWDEDKHPRADDGKFTSGPDSNSETPEWTARVLEKAHQPDGGFTVHAVTGSQPTTGYAVSVFKGREAVFDVKTLTGKDLWTYAKANWDLLVDADNYFGGWHNPDDGRVYLDVSKVVKSRADAEQLGRAHQQIGIFDFQSGQSIKLGERYTNSYGQDGPVSHRPARRRPDAGRYRSAVQTADRQGHRSSRLGGDPGGLRRDAGHQSEIKLDDWDESKHPRDDEGRFSATGGSFEDYHEQALHNLGRTSRTASGVSDTSSSKDKPKLTAEGKDLAHATGENFTRALQHAYDQRDAAFDQSADVEAFVMETARTVSHGLIQPGQSLYRTWEGDEQYGYAKPAEIMPGLKAYASELQKRLARNADPVETAAWHEWTYDPRLHPFADGVGRSSKVISAMILMRGRRPLPRYPDRKTYYKEITKDLDSWTSYYKTLFPKAARALADWDESQHPRDDDGKFATKDGGGGSDTPEKATPASPRDRARAEFGRLKAKWAKVNNDLLEYVDKPNAPEVNAKMDELKGIVKEMYRLDADPGGLEGIGLPGGARDIIVVGAGPGGLAAAVMGGTDGLDTLFIDANTTVGGQAKYSSRIENYPGFPIGTSGRHLAENLYEQAQRVGAEGMLGVRVTGLAYNEETGEKTLTLSNGETVTGRTVIVAGGVEFHKLDFPGAESKSVIYADGERLAKEGAGKPVVVIGGSNGAAQAALGAARTAQQVYVVSRSAIDKSMSDYQVTALRNNPKINVIENDEISKLFLDDHGNATEAALKSGRKVSAAAVGVFIGGASNTSWLPSTVQKRDGKIVVNDGLETSVPGVFAIGDIRHGSIGRIGAAVGDGQLAERNVFQYFDKLRAELSRKSKTGAVAAAERAPRRKDIETWDRLVDELFALDAAHPWLSATIEAQPTKTAFADWDESLHPRDDDGKFATKDGGGSSTDAATETSAAPEPTKLQSELAAKHGLSVADVITSEQRIREEATTDAEREFATELAIADVRAAASIKDGDTKAKHVLPDGGYTAERQALHAHIAKQFFEDHLAKYGRLPEQGLKNPVVTFMSGLPGAGKSTAAKDIQESDKAWNIVSIDPDAMKKYLPEYQDGVGTVAVARESGDIADRMLEYAAQKRMNIVIDGTMKTSGSASPATWGDGALGKMAAFKDAGYRVEVRFIDVTVNQSITRTVNRYVDQYRESGRGRYVPPSVTRKMADPVHGTAPRRSFEMAKATSFHNQPLVDAWRHVNGWTGEEVGTSGTLTAGGSK